MIKILVKRKNDVITYVELKGHANYSEAGSDIVCAAVSSIVQTSLNACLRFNEEAFSYCEKEGFIEIANVSDDKIIQELLLNMLFMLEQLVGDYPKNINIRNEG